MKRSALILILLIFALHCMSQVTFEKSFYINGNDQGNRVIQTSDGGYVICGVTSNGVINFLLKTGQNGDSLWMKEYPGGLYHASNNHQLLMETRDSGFIFTSAFYDKLILIKTDKKGDTLRTTAFPGISSGVARPTKDNGFIICGNDSTRKVALVKTDSNLQEQWRTHVFTVTEMMAGISDFSICQTSDEGFLLGGNCIWSDSPPFPITLYTFLERTNSAGDSLWAIKSHPLAYQTTEDLLLSNDNNFAAVGSLDSVSNNNHAHLNGYIVKINSMGDTIWSKCIGGQGNQEFNSFEQTDDGGYIACGDNNPAPYPPTYGSYGFYLVRMNSSGDTLWTKSYPGPSDIIGQSVHETSDHGFIATGNYYKTVDVSTVFLIKTDANGDVFAEGTNDKEQLSLLTLFPNPTTGKVYLNPPGKFKTMEITDILGNVVLRRNLDPDNNNTITSDLTGNPKGVYLVKLKNEKSVSVGKIILK